MNCKCVASFLCSLAFTASSAFAEIPETAWIVTEPTSSGGAATIEDGTGWKFSLTANGIFTKSAVGMATALNFRTMNLECGYQITTIQQSFLDGNTVVEELYGSSCMTVGIRSRHNLI